MLMPGRQRSARKVKGPLPMISVALPGPNSSPVRSSVSFETRPELIVETACAKPGDGAVKWNFTVRSSTTSPRS